jgi:hypothetical protein
MKHCAARRNDLNEAIGVSFPCLGINLIEINTLNLDKAQKKKPLGMLPVNLKMWELRDSNQRPFRLHRDALNQLS